MENTRWKTKNMYSIWINKKVKLKINDKQGSPNTCLFKVFIVFLLCFISIGVRFEYVIDNVWKIWTIPKIILKAITPDFPFLESVVKLRRFFSMRDRNVKTQIIS